MKGKELNNLLAIIGPFAFRISVINLLETVTYKLVIRLYLLRVVTIFPTSTYALTKTIRNARKD